MSISKSKWYVWAIVVNIFSIVSLLVKLNVLEFQKDIFLKYSIRIGIFAIIIFFVMGILDKWRWINIRELKKDKVLAFLLLLEIAINIFHVRISF